MDFGNKVKSSEWMNEFDFEMLRNGIDIVFIKELVIEKMKTAMDTKNRKIKIIDSEFICEKIQWFYVICKPLVTYVVKIISSCCHRLIDKKKRANSVTTIFC